MVLGMQGKHWRGPAVHPLPKMQLPRGQGGMTEVLFLESLLRICDGGDTHYF